MESLGHHRTHDLNRGNDPMESGCRDSGSQGQTLRCSQATQPEAGKSRATASQGYTITEHKKADPKAGSLEIVWRQGRE